MITQLQVAKAMSVLSTPFVGFSFFSLDDRLVLHRNDYVTMMVVTVFGYSSLCFSRASSFPPPEKLIIPF